MLFCCPFNTRKSLASTLLCIDAFADAKHRRLTPKALVPSKCETLPRFVCDSTTKINLFYRQEIIFVSCNHTNKQMFLQNSLIFQIVTK